MTEAEEYIRNLKVHLQVYNDLKKLEALDECRTNSEDKLINKMIEHELSCCTSYIKAWYYSDEQVEKRKRQEEDRIRKEIADAQRKIDAYNLAHPKRKRGRPKKVMEV